MKKYLILISFLNSLILFPQDRITGEPFSTRSEVIASNGMVATSHPLATQVGIDILKKGGNAIDAAIAANAAIGLMEPTGNGIGGDLFAIIWIEKEKKLYGLNASGRSPSSLDLDFLKLITIQVFQHMVLYLLVFLDVLMDGLSLMKDLDQ